MTGIQSKLFSLLRYEINGGGSIPDIYPEELAPLYNLSCAHDLAHLAGIALSGLPVLSDASEYAEKFKTAQIMAEYRYVQTEYEENRIYETLEKAGIDYIPLKGAVIKHFYPSPEMRTSCDIDILVREEDAERAVSLLSSELSFRFGGRTTHDYSGTAPDGVRAEIHFGLVEYDSKISSVLSGVWETAEKEEAGHRYRMTDEMFIAYHMAHMAKHFVHGGCGIRPFMDLYLIKKNKPGISENTISECGLLAFYRKSLILADSWFSGKTPDPSVSDMSDYILSAGVYGSVLNRAAVSQVKNGGKSKHIISRLLISADVLEQQYPKLKKHRWLLPYYRTKRLFIYLRKDGLKRGKKEFVAMDRAERISGKTEELLRSLGLLENEIK